MNKLPNSVPESQEAWQQSQDYLNRLRQANGYLGYCVEEGYLEPEEFFGKTDMEKIEFAEDLMNKADYKAEALKEREEEDPRADYPLAEQQ